MVEPGEHLAREGASGYFFFVILDGTAEVPARREGRRARPGRLLRRTAVLEATRRNATVTATTPMVVGAMFGADFAKSSATRPSCTPASPR